MTDSLDDMLKRSRELVAMFEAADALTALIEARATFQDIADTWESGMEWSGGDEEEAAAYAGKARAAISAIDALGKETQDER